MSYPPQLGPLDRPGDLNGDRVWRGIESRLAGHAVLPGFGTHARNCRFDQGVPETRGGYIRPSWANAAAVDFPNTSANNALFTTDEDLSGVTTAADAGDYAAWGALYGWCWFTDPYTHGDYLIVASETGLHWCAPGTVGGTLPLPSGVTLDDAVEFTQVFNVLILHRTAGRPPLVLEQISAGFHHPSTPAQGDGTIQIPNAEWSVTLGNRLLVPDGPDGFAVSDYLDYLRYLPGLSNFQFNEGTSDRIVAAVPFNDQTVVVLKGQSIHAATNLTADLTAVAQTEITREYGLVGRKAVTRVGTDLWFLSRQGVMTLNQTTQQKVQANAVAKSFPISKLIARINWSAAHRAVMATYDRKVFLAVPLDGATACNKILIYDLVNEAWIGWDDLPDVEIFDLKVITTAGREQLLVATTEGVILQYDEAAFEDQIPTAGIAGDATHRSIVTEFTTREYARESGARQRASHVWFDVQHWGPCLTLTATSPDAFDTQTILTAWTPGPTRYRQPMDADEWDRTNVNGDFCTPGREDYAVLLDGEFDWTAGVPIDVHQETPHEMELTLRNRSFRLEFSSSAGRMRLMQVRAASLDTPYRDGTL